MEKPSPTYDRTSRLSYSSKEDQAQKERYYDRMTLRGISVLRDTDQQEDIPTWRGDHTFSSDAATYSLTHFIEPEVAREHPDWSHEQVTHVATKRFEQRLEQDLSYEHKESAHEESVVHWQPIQTKEGSWELATAYGDTMVTLSELWEHTREYAEFAGNPAAYNPDEHRAQIRMQEELITGAANGFVSVLSHPDAIRYVQVWQKTDDGAIISKQVDLYKTTGRDFTHEEGGKLIDNLAAFFKEDVGGGEASVVSYAHIYIHEKEVTEDDIRTIAIAQSMDIHDSLPQSVIDTSIPKIFMNVGVGITRDTTEGMYQLGTYLKDHIDKKIAAFKTRNIVVQKTTSEISSARISNLRMDHKEVAIHIFSDTALPKEQKTDTAPDIASETMKSVAAEWWMMRSMLQYKDMAPVAPIAIIYWLKDAASVHSLVIGEQKKGIEHPLRNSVSEPTKMQRLGASIRHAFSFMMKDKEVQKVNEHTLHVNGESERTVEDQLLVHENSPLSDVSIPEKEVVEFSKPTVDMLLGVLQSLLHQEVLESLRQTHVSIDGKEEQNRFVRDAIVHKESPVVYLSRQYSIAIIIWWLTEYTRQTSQKQFDASFLSDGNEDGHREEIQVGENLPSSWLLLSIIWYLAALREHGKQNMPMKKTQSKKHKKNKQLKTGSLLPSTGIIFTFGS